MERLERPQCEKLASPALQVEARLPKMCVEVLTHLGLLNVAFFGDRVIAGVIKFRCGHDGSG